MADVLVKEMHWPIRALWKSKRKLKKSSKNLQCNSGPKSRPSQFPAGRSQFSVYSRSSPSGGLAIRGKRQTRPSRPKLVLACLAMVSWSRNLSFVLWLGLSPVGLRTPDKNHSSFRTIHPPASLLMLGIWTIIHQYLSHNSNLNTRIMSPKMSSLRVI